MHRVTFVLKGEAARVVAAEASSGETLTEAAHGAGIELAATCGGRGACRSCRVKILKGRVPPATVQDRTQLGAEAVKERFRLGCQTKVVAPCTVLIAAPHTESGHQILGPRADDFPRKSGTLDCGIEKYAVEIGQSVDHAAERADVERLIAALPLRVSTDVPLEVLRGVPHALNDQAGIATVTVANGAVIDVEAGDTSAFKYGVAFDIGTTTIVGTLLDLGLGERVDSMSKVNPQSVYGGDLMSRIAVVQANEAKLNTLRAVVFKALNDFINEATRKFGIAPRHLYKVTVVGNSCMHHILLGIDVTPLGLAPYAPVVRAALQVPAREISLKSAPRSSVYFLPLVAGFVGADTVGAVLATGVHQGNQTRLLVDIGTNTEVVISTGGRMVACSAPAGPAFKGGEIRHGMRAAVGAIESVEIGEDVRCGVIGDVAPIGICGSGLVDAAAKMLDAGVIEPSGVFRQGVGSRSPQRYERAFGIPMREGRSSSSCPRRQAERARTSQSPSSTPASYSLRKALSIPPL